MNTALAIAATSVALVVAGGLGYAAAELTAPDPTDPAPREVKQCETWGYFTDGECFSAGTLRFVFLSNLQGANVFCLFEKSAPGDWTRAQAYAETGIPPVMKTWMGAALQNILQAYFATGAPTFIIEPNTAPNRCKAPLPAPVISGVTPGETDVTVTVGG